MNSTHPAATESAELILRPLALSASGMSGADVEDLVKEARETAFLQKRSITYADIAEALRSRKPAKSDKLLFRLANHEAAHAVVRIYLGLGTISFITLNGSGGSSYVTGLNEGIDVLTEKTVIEIMVIHLAGRAAEEEFCDCLSSGAGGADFSDLALATKLAFDMETTLGFGGQWPLLYRNVEDRSSVLAYDKSLAERVNRRLEAAYEAARKIVVRQQKAIEYLAGCLLMHETLEGPDLDSAIQKVKGFLA